MFQLPDAELPLRVPVARAPPPWGFATEIELPDIVPSSGMTVPLLVVAVP